MKLWQTFCVIFTLLTLSQITIGEEMETLKKPNKKENICKTQPNGAILPNPNDCHKFHICVRQKPYEYNCDPEFHFDPATRKCEIGSSCGNDLNKPANCSDGSVRPVQEDCFIFEACVKGQYQKLNCPPNYYFNAKQLLCVPFKYDAEFKCNCLMPEHTVMENINNCETYFVCRDKAAILQNCPIGQYYNADLNACIIDLEGVCLMKPTIPPGLIIESNNQLDKVKLTEDDNVEKACARLGLEDIHFETFPKGCNTFYICVRGQLYTQHCPPDFYYDKVNKYCVIDDLGQCSDTEDLTVAN